MNAILPRRFVARGEEDLEPFWEPQPAVMSAGASARMGITVTSIIKRFIVLPPFPRSPPEQSYLW